MKSRKTKVFGLVLTASIAFCLVGCAQEIQMPQITDVTEDMLVVDELGVVTSFVVADFDKDYYVEDELATMILDELKEFNTKMQEFVPSDVLPAVLNDTHRAEGKIVVQYTFANGTVYGQYQIGELDCFTGTVADALSAGYLEGAKLLSVGKGKELDLTTNDKVLDKQIVIWQGSTPVLALSNPQYISENVELSEIDGHTMKIQGAEGEVGYCIMK
ncbi:MAG: hypothetical protein IJW63_09835 [Lachnospiraceae bacterium]|nr:hypothetical protein [Lachnospiraceae bacterium]